MMTTPLYQQAFGTDFDLGITLPAAFSDVSYKNDAGASFSEGQLKVWVLPAVASERDIDAPRYALIAGEEEQRLLFESESAAEFQAVIDDESEIQRLLAM